MGVDYFNCEDCNGIICDCGEYYTCENCYSSFCIDCKDSLFKHYNDNSEVEDSKCGEEEGGEEGDYFNSCIRCSKLVNDREFTNSEILSYLLINHNLNMEDIKQKMLKSL